MHKQTACVALKDSFPHHSPPFTTTPHFPQHSPPFTTTPHLPHPSPSPPLLTFPHHSSDISVELQDRISKVDRLRKRYEILTVSMQPPDGEGGGEQSQAYYVIKVHQKEFLSGYELPPALLRLPRKGKTFKELGTN